MLFIQARDVIEQDQASNHQNETSRDDEAHVMESDEQLAVVQHGQQNEVISHVSFTYLLFLALKEM